MLTPELSLCGYPPEDQLLRPAFLAACTLVSLGIQQFQPLVRQPVWLVLVGLLAVLAGSKFQAFHAYMNAESDTGQFTIMHRELMKYPGKKVIFFDVGYDGQHLEYVTRDDPDVSYATMRGRGWASGGAYRITEEYVRSTIEHSQGTTRCFFYFVHEPGGPVAKAFVPTLERKGYRRTPRFPLIWGHEVVGYCPI